VKVVKTILGALILLVCGLLLAETLPAYWTNFQMDRMLSEQAIYYSNTFPLRSNEAVALGIAQKAQDLNVIVDPEQVLVSRDGGGITLRVSYTIHVNFPGYPFDLNFQNSAVNRITR
jgi:hypothetical protein